MKYWQQFLDSFDSSGGHIFVLTGLLVVGYAMNNIELTTASMGALFAVLRVGNPKSSTP